MTMSNREPAFESECHRFADALAALVDEAPGPRDRRRVDAHLAGCEACRELLADLQAIRSLAATLEPIEPPARVWRDVRRRVAAESRTPRVAAEGRASRVAASWWSRRPFGGAKPIRTTSLRSRWSVGGTALAAAAGIVLAVVLTGSPDPARSPASDTPGGTVRPAPGGAVRPAPGGGLGPFESAYASAIRDLEQLAGARPPVLPVVRTVLAGNLAVVERAIAESRSAVEAAPGSEVARDRLRAGLANKLALLRTSAALGVERIERR